jgi:putative transposase
MSNGRIYQLSHCTYICKYHLVFTTKYRDKVLVDNYIKQELKRIFKMIGKWKGFPIHAWHVGDEHIHLHLTIPPKYSVSYAVAIIKGKSSAWIKKKTNKFPKGTLWSTGYFVSTVGLNEMAVKRYVENQRHHQVELVQEKLPFWRRR